MRQTFQQDSIHSSCSKLSICPPGWPARMFYHLLPIRRKTVLENLRIVFGGELSEREIRWLAQGFWGHILRSLIEDTLMAFRGREWLKKQIRIEGDQNLIRATEQGKGILVLTGHFGNWEFAPVAGILHFPELRGRFHILRRRLVNKWIEKIVFKRFYEAGLDVIPKKNSLGLVLDALSRNDVVTFIMDQHAKPGKDGVVVDFFGKPAGTFRSLAMVARATGAPVVPAHCYRAKDGRHVLSFLEPLEWESHPDPEKEIMENTQIYNRTLEKFVRLHPEQWWWVHRRWKI